jgi:hypothetical protein
MKNRLPNGHAGVPLVVHPSPPMMTLRTKWLVFLLAPALLTADPSEDRTAWPNPPVGFHWDQVGPRTSTIDLSCYAIVLHVSPSGSDARGDGSASRPWRSVRQALRTAAPEGRTGILVAAGIYTEGTIALQPSVDLFGGYEPTSWVRDILRHPTILSGGGGGRVLLGADDCWIDGFIIEEGVARGHGGAFLCDDRSPTITNNVFRGNRTLRPEESPHDSDRRRVRGHDGGAIALLNGSHADVRHNLFHSNETEKGYGGALSAAHDCLPIVGHNIFWGNRAGVTDRSRSGNGGAVALIFSSRAAIMHNLFVANSTLGQGDGGAVFMEYFCWPEVAFNAFVNNRADDDGGGLDHQKFSHPKVRANLFYGNTARKSGGGVHGDDSLIELENNIFAYNRAERQGAGLGATHSWVRAINNTFAYNEAQRNGGGIHLVNIKNPFLRPSTLRNNLLALNTPGQAHFDSEVDVAYNIMHPGGFATGYYNFAHPPGFRDDSLQLVVQSVRSDPAGFVTTLAIAGTLDAATLTGRIVRLGDHWSMVRSNTEDVVVIWGPAPPAGEPLEILPTFRLAPDSPAINSGAYPDFPPFDIDGEPRYYPNIDIGADEYHAETHALKRRPDSSAP